MKYIIRGIVLVLFLISAPIYVARAEYVLPYPSYMPGNSLYKVSRLLDRVKQPVYFGNISSYKYYLGLADKYLVEAKTLFEYRQYLLAVDALIRSDRHFAVLSENLARAQNEGKDVSAFRWQLNEASDRHISVLQRIQAEVPDTFTWTPEKTEQTRLELSNILEDSLSVRGREKIY